VSELWAWIDGLPWQVDVLVIWLICAVAWGRLAGWLLALPDAPTDGGLMDDEDEPCSH